MYLIDREQIIVLLEFMEKRLEQFKEVSNDAGVVSELALERYADVMIASILDVGHMLIDGFMMRDAGSYEDIICILADEQVIPENEKAGLIKFVSLRPKLMRNYAELDTGEIAGIVQSVEPMLRAFPQYVRTYLETEEKVAHAFGKKE